ncbi:MAG TPA: BlaI/MecI/CopY family transcriptional regulator [Candidatus Acidoferrales bacterium]|nr:BlaI/MecI/CopY family transcriptional regulator [Candidatus Acidoferrales bacterium]
MNSPSNGKRDGERRRSILDLAPFELDCMNALWPMEEATVRQVQEALSARRPRAYTTIMTILDRMAQKGVVARRKVGRTYVYRANLRPADAQEKAIEQVVAGFFGGSREALAAHLAGKVALASPNAPARPQAVVSSLPAQRIESEPERIAPPDLDKTLL